MMQLHSNFCDQVVINIVNNNNNHHLLNWSQNPVCVIMIIRVVEFENLNIYFKTKVADGIIG